MKADGTEKANGENKKKKEKGEPATFARRRRPKTQPLKWDTLKGVFNAEIRPTLVNKGIGASLHEDCQKGFT